ncbi:hypothetical protein [Tumebacillus permanentifrigoris]|uniref:Uncharacterized protein n=1 Tax=Tumebacillus permanentifrigoris TaxID=378543 RepID=A0A316DA77_9BACL|nr:hypothetical protein [Tumebacillus permanentifrigoris]PWK09059.1 hypothetical protein C7459_114127 [Tumebacillus permanentifrigoris]
MRKSIHQQVSAYMNKRLLNVDFHDFLQKQIYLEDVELATEFSLTSREVQQLRTKLQR